MNQPAATPPRQLDQSVLWFISVLIGVVAGLGAVVFRALIAIFHNLFFLGTWSVTYDANQHTAASPWGLGIILVPMIGAVGVSFLVSKFAPEAKGHGVPEVMEAVYYRNGVIRPVVAVVKSLASALSIGTGGSVGREGPIVQIGSSFGSTLGQMLRLSSWQTITMVAAGAGGGIAATFNTPIGGILFAAELLLPEISARTLIPVALSTATATYLGRILLSANPSFVISGFETPAFHPTNPYILLACAALGLCAGIVSAGFIKAIYRAEDFFDQKVKGNYYVKHVLGMLPLGILIYLMQANFGHYYIQGVGYATVQDVLSGTLPTLSLMMLLFVLKLVATSLTLGSGGSGGIFSPSLFMGATFGALFGMLLNLLFPQLPINPSAFAVVGMAALVGSTTGAAITSIVMIFEMTLDYNIILPMAIAVAIAYGIRTYLLRDSIYSLKLNRRGQPIPESLQANFFLVRHARDYMDSATTILPLNASVEAMQEAVDAANNPTWVLVEDDGELEGLIRTEVLKKHLLEDEVYLTEIIRRDYQVVTANSAFFELVEHAVLPRPALFIVVDDPNDTSVHAVRGVIGKSQITQAMAEALTPD